MSKVTGHRWMPPALISQAPQVQVETNPMQKAAFGLTTFFILMLYSRFQDFISSLHLPAITLFLAILWMIASGNVRTVAKISATKYFVLMTAFMFASIPFSVWPGGAADTVVKVWLKALVVYAVVATSIIIPRYCTRLMSVAAFGIVCGTLIGLAVGNDSARMGEINARFGDANEFAQVLLIGMCLMLGYSATPGRNAFARLVAYFALIVMLVAFFRTGSRGGFLGLLTVVVFLFIKNSASVKAIILVLVVIVTTCVLIFLPGTLKYRYGALLGLVAENRSTVDAIAAAGSVQGRQYLLVKSIEITLRHPIVGEGAGMFAVAENSVAVQEGRARGSWHETHNMYTQVSSENGIPAFIFFVAAIVAAFRTVNRVIALGKDSTDSVILEASRSAYWIRLALLAMASSGFFLSIAYTNELQVLIAFAMGLSYSVECHMQLAQSQSPAPAATVLQSPVGYRKPVRTTWSNA